MSFVKSLRRLVGVGGMLGLAATCGVAHGDTPEYPAGYRVTEKLALPGSGFDYMAIDVVNRRLYVSTDEQENVIDVQTNKLVGTLANLPNRNHGVAISNREGHGFTSSSDGTSTMFDLKTLKVIKVIKLGIDRPDGLNYDPATNRVFIFSHYGKAAALDAKTGTVVGTFDIPSAEFSAPDGRGHIFLNLDKTNELAEIDAKNLKVLHTWPLKDCDTPHGLAMDTKSRRLFIGCKNSIFLVVNADTGAVVTSFPVGKGNDATRFDPGTMNAFASSGAGQIAVIHEDSPDKYTFVGNIATERRARVMEVDPVTHTLYTVTQKIDEQRNEDNVVTTFNFIPDTLRLLVIPNH
ncbi:MAG: YncE family protein [Proteobacteria bacterium]|nr:YncE family protein [Pseudomonadota bacterium]